MKNYKLLFTSSLLTALLSACSPIDSLRPFDDEQAKILLQENFARKPTQQMTVNDKNCPAHSSF